MTEHSEMIPGERTSRTPVVQQRERTAECDGFHGRCPDAGRFGPEQVGTIAGTMAAYERDKAASELAAAMAEARQLRELLAEILATFGTPSRPGTVRWTAKQVAGWRERAGIEMTP